MDHQHNNDAKYNRNNSPVGDIINRESDTKNDAKYNRNNIPIGDIINTTISPSNNTNSLTLVSPLLQQLYQVIKQLVCIVVHYPVVIMLYVMLH